MQRFIRKCGVFSVVSRFYITRKLWPLSLHFNQQIHRRNANDEENATAAATTTTAKDPQVDRFFLFMLFVPVWLCYTCFDVCIAYFGTWSPQVAKNATHHIHTYILQSVHHNTRWNSLYQKCLLNEFRDNLIAPCYSIRSWIFLWLMSFSRNLFRWNRCTYSLNVQRTSNQTAIFVFFRFFNNCIRVWCLMIFLHHLALFIHDEFLLTMTFIRFIGNVQVLSFPIQYFGK